MTDKFESDPKCPRDLALALDLLTEMYERERISLVEYRALGAPLHEAVIDDRNRRAASDRASIQVEPIASSPLQVRN